MLESYALFKIIQINFFAVMTQKMSHSNKREGLYKLVEVVGTAPTSTFI